MLKLNDTINSIAVQFENSTIEEVEKSKILDVIEKKGDKGIGIFNTDIINGFKWVAKTLKIKYPGRTVSIWKGSENYVCSGPAIFSDGSQVVINWGGDTFPLEGEIGRINKNIRIVRSKLYRMDIPILIKWETEEEKEENEDLLNDFETWEEVFESGILKERIELLTVKNGLFDGEYDELEIVDFDLKTGKNGNYYMTKVSCEQGTYNIFLPEEAEPEIGGTVTVLADEKCFELNGEKYSAGGFIKLTELKIGQEYKVTSIVPKTGKYAGYSMKVVGVGTVDANSQFERWIKSADIDDISEDNPVIFKVVSITGSDKKKAILRIKKKGASLADLIGGTTTTKKKTTAKKKVSKSVEPEETEEEADEVQPKAKAKSTKAKKTKVAKPEPEEENEEPDDDEDELEAEVDEEEIEEEEPDTDDTEDDEDDDEDEWM